MQLSDYAQALGAAQRLVPDFRDQQQQDAQIRALDMQPALIKAQIAGQEAQAQAGLLKQNRQAAFQTRLQALGAKPSPQAYRALGAEFPEFSEAVGRVAEGLDGDQAKSLVRRLAPIQSLIANKRYDAAASEVKRHLDADKAAGLPEDEDDKHLYEELISGDQARQETAGGTVYGILSSLDPKNAAVNATKVMADRNHVVSAGGALVDENGRVLYQADSKPEYRTIKNADGSESIVQVNGEGGGPTSSGGAAGTRGDVSRLINSDAGGGYVPDSVKTLGQFVSYGRDMNRRGATSSSAGTYQINGTTMAEFAPKALGADWRTAPFNAENQDKVGKAIFDWAKQQSNPAAALKGRWVSLSAQSAANLVRGSWEQAKGTIAQGETGGGPRASASAAARGGDGAKVVFTSKPGSPNPVDQESVNFYAQKIAAGGDLPQLGSGKESSQWRRAILQKAAQIQSGRGLSGGESNLAQADVKASRSALLQAQKQYTSTVGFEDTFQRNVKEVLRLAPQGVGGSSPIFNRWIQAGRKNVSGDPAVSAFNVAVNTAANEYAKLASGASGGAVTSDSARHEAMEILNNAQTLPQLRAALRQMQIDGHNRVIALDTQLDRLRNNISGAGGARGQAQPARVSPPQGGKLVGMYQGRQVFQLPNGKRVVAK